MQTSAQPSERKKIRNIAAGDETPRVALGKKEDANYREVEADALAIQLHGMFVDAANQRHQREVGWLRTLGRLKARDDYVPDQHVHEARPPKADEGSEATVRVGNTKCRQTTARMHDMVFGGDFRAFRMSPTPKPDLPGVVLKKAIMDRVQKKYEEEAAVYGSLDDAEYMAGVMDGTYPDMSVMQQTIAAGRIPEELQITREEMDELIKEVAEKRANAMTRTIRDQLKEMGFARQSRLAMRGGNNYGTSWMRSVQSEEVEQTDFKDTGNGFEPVKSTAIKPFIEFRSMWDVYPYPATVSDVANCSHMFDRQLLNKVQVRDLRNIDGYDRDAINEYIRQFPNGDASEHRYHWETTMYFGNRNNNQAFDRYGMYEVLDCIGYFEADEIQPWIDEELDPNDSHRACVSYLGHRIIRVVLEPWSRKIPLMSPYQFEEDETSIWGEGLMDLMRDPELTHEACARALINDMGKVGEVWTADNDTILPEDQKNLHHLRDGTVIRYTGRKYDTARQPLQRIDIPTNVGVILQGMAASEQWMDETSGMPRMAAGMADGGTEDTVGVTSMRMHQANIVLKEPMSNFLECQMHPVIYCLYEWNMLYNDDDAIKGDMDVIIEDVNKLLASEIQSQRVELLAANTANPMDAPYIKRGELNEERFKTSGMDADRFVRSEEEVAKMQAIEAEKMQQGRETPEVL